jgi:hypothetical protein
MVRVRLLAQCIHYVDEGGVMVFRSTGVRDTHWTHSEGIAITWHRNKLYFFVDFC